MTNSTGNAPSLAHARKDLHGTRQDLLSGATTCVVEMARSIELALAPACKDVFLTTRFDAAKASSARAGVERTPLAGLAISIKDLFDMAGETTRAGSIVLVDAPEALVDCPAVARLTAAGGSILGRTNMVEFAFSGVGTNPHYGTPANAADGTVARIPGGSSSGGVVSVATGAAFIGLGSDTGGSVRIPAALNGVVGFKCTARLVPTQGAYPLSTSMDTVCAMTRSVRDAILAHEILSASKVCKSYAPLAGYRLAVATTQMQDALEPPVAKAWQNSLNRLRQRGADIVDIALPELLDLPGILATGGLSPAESYAWHYPMLQTQSHRYDPRVLTRIQRGANMSARDYIDLLTARRLWIGRMEKALAPFDAVLSPTVPVVAPPIADVAPGAERDEAFFALNGKLLRNTSVVNMLDGCAISIPCQQPGDLPVGLMVWAPAMQDDTVLNIALQIESILQNK